MQFHPQCGNNTKEKVIETINATQPVLNYINGLTSIWGGGSRIMVGDQPKWKSKHCIWWIRKTYHIRWLLQSKVLWDRSVCTTARFWLEESCQTFWFLFVGFYLFVCLIFVEDPLTLARLSLKFCRHDDKKNHLSSVLP